MAAKKKILVPATISPGAVEVLRKRDDVDAVLYEVTISAAQFHELLKDAHGVALSMTPFGEAELKAAPQIKVVARIGVGFDAVDVPALTRHNIPLMVTGNANSPTVAENALFLMMALAKLGAHFDAMTKENRWWDRMKQLPSDLFEKTVVVVGFGRIGTRTSRFCRALGMNVLVYDPYVRGAVIEGAGYTPVSDLDAALAQADFVTIHCPKNDETRGMFNAARLARMKPSAYLVNTARGGIIDEKALHAALTSGKLAGAGLDVFETEPVPSDNALLKLANVIAAPHMAGVTRESVDRMGVTTVTNILDVLDGKPNLENVVNRDVYKHR
jgi:D-3-phosphoglycerate dehydrogenase / 2-oxoglutarate reductase